MLDWATQQEHQYGLDGNKTTLVEWRTTWQEDKKRQESWWCSVAAQDWPCKSTLLLYNQLKKTESSVLIQARTGRIRLRQFLFKAKVPGVNLASCSSGKGLETAENLLFCDHVGPRAWSRETQFEKLIFNPASTKQLTRQLIQSGRC